MKNNFNDVIHGTDVLIPDTGEAARSDVSLDEGAIIYQSYDMRKGKRRTIYVRNSVIALLIIVFLGIIIYMIKDPLFDYLASDRSDFGRVYSVFTDIVSVDYVDVADDAWYAGAVERVTKEKLMSEKSKHIFGPRDPMTRAEVAEVIYKLEKKPRVKTNSNFDDVKTDAWYSAAITWLHEREIVVGNNGLFRPNDTITYEEIASILWKYSIFKGYCSAYDAENALRWAIDKKLIKGSNETGIDPKEEVNRAKCAVIITRYLDSVIK